VGAERTEDGHARSARPGAAGKAIKKKREEKKQPNGNSKKPGGTSGKETGRLSIRRDQLQRSPKDGCSEAKNLRGEEVVEVRKGHWVRRAEKQQSGL